MYAKVVDEWLHRALWWQEQEDFERILDQQKRLPQLDEFLQQLLDEFKQLGSVEVVLQAFPQVGQLLGRLGTLPLTSESCYKALMRCVLFFCASQPRSAVEARAKQWALSLLRSTVCGGQHEFSSNTLDVTGVSQEDFNLQLLQEVAAQLTNQFRSSPSSLSLDHETSQDGLCRLDDVCRICVHLRGHAEFSRLLDFAMECVWRSACREPKWIECLTEITQSQSTAYIDTSLCPLPYTTQRLLWQLKLESLEQEVLLLVGAVNLCSFLAKRHVFRLINSRHLVTACVEHFDIYEAVFGMLTRLLHDGDAANTVAFVIGCLHECVRSEFGSSKYDPPLSILAHYDCRLRTLITVLLVAPQDPHALTIECQVKVISRLLRDLLVDSTDVVYHVLLQFQAWYHIALFLALTATKSVVNSCVTVITVFRGHSTRMTPDDLHTSQTYLADTVFSLRRLFNEPSLQPDDVTAVTLTSQDTCHDDVMTDLIGQLLMLFLVLSSGGHLMHKTIFRLTVGQENAGHLACLMDTLQILADHLPHWLVKPHIVFSHIRTIVDFLVCNVRTSGCGTDTDSLPLPSSHCLPSPKIYGHSSRPITVIKDQWRDLCAYFE